MVAAGSFREDLFYRLNVLKFETVPLRERPDDIVPSALFALRRHAQAYASPATDLALDLHRALAPYPWPGNFRQLSNVMERIAILADAPVVASARPLPSPCRRRCGAAGRPAPVRRLRSAQRHVWQGPRPRVVARVLSLKQGPCSRLASRPRR